MLHLVVINVVVVLAVVEDVNIAVMDVIVVVHKNVLMVVKAIVVMVVVLVVLSALVDVGQVVPMAVATNAHRPDAEEDV